MSKFFLTLCLSLLIFLFFRNSQIEVCGNCVTEFRVSLVKRARPGIVVYRRYPVRSIQYLLLQGRYKGRQWTPPHSEYRDRYNYSEPTALRALEQLTGLQKGDLSIAQDFMKHLNYIIQGVPKSGVYLLAQLNEPKHEIKLSNTSLDFKWATLEEACDLVQHEYLRDLLFTCYNHINLNTTNVKK